MTNSEIVMVSRPDGPCRTTHGRALTLVAQRDGEVSGAPGASPGVPWSSARVCFGSTPTLRATVIPKPGARRLHSAFHPGDDPGRAGEHPRSPGARVYVTRAAIGSGPSATCASRFNRRLPGAPRSAAPAPPPRAWIQAPSPCGGVMQGWGRFGRGRISRTLSLSQASSHGQPKAGPGDPGGGASLSPRLGSPGPATPAVG